ncbi:MAG TPA: HEAT repeat domain-containing protein [Candidatus Nitrosotenuis sp.]|nr:HEAT repeat domain-containing protein [Candidatus Nitrosotenuis sp.]
MTKLVIPPEKILHQAKIELKIPNLVKALESPNAMVRESSILVLGKLGDESSLSHIKKMFHDKNLVVRCVAASVLKKMGDESGVNVVIDCIKTGNRNVKLVAIKTLLDFKENYNVLNPLIETLNSDSPEIRYLANNVLEKITKTTMNFNHLAPKNERENAIRKWMSWLQSKRAYP